MKLYIVEDDSSQLIDLKLPQERIHTNHFKFTVIQLKDKYLIRTSSEMIVERTVLSLYEWIHMNDTKSNHCMLLLIEDNAGYHTYQKYQITKEVLIGNGFLCDVCINNALLDLENIKIDPTCNMIYLKHKNLLCSLNSKIIDKDIAYSFGDTLFIAGTRIIFFKEGMMMNCNENVTVHLPFFNNVNLNRKILIPKKKVRKYNQIPEVITTFFYEYQTVSMQRENSFKQPIFLTIGPSIFMSVASIFVGLMSIYNAYLNGRDIISVLPIVLLPIVMFISTILFQPLNKKYEAKYENERLLRIEQEDNEKKELIKNDYSNFIQEYKRLTNIFYPDIQCLIQQLENCEYSYIQTKEKPIMIRVGEKNDIIHCKNLISSHKSDLKLSYTDPLAWLIHFDEYKSIHIITHDHFNEVFRFFILQLAFRYERKVIILSSNTFINNNKWILSMNNVIEKDRLLVFDDLNKVKNRIDDNKNYIVIAINKDITKRENLNIMSFNSYSYENIDLILNYDTLNYFDYKKCEEGSFNFEFYKIHEIDRYLFLLRNHQLKYIENDFFSIHVLTRISKESIKDNWLLHHVDHSLEALIGIDDNDQIIQLNLNENVDGPHGLISGTTGSGKTELLLSMILSISFNYSFEEVQFIYIDFKGGGGVNALRGLPHLIGTLTNLQQNTIERALVSFQNECKYREECISKMNKISESTIMNIYDYRNHYKSYFDLPKLPDLVIVVDEFAELKR